MTNSHPNHNPEFVSALGSSVSNLGIRHPLDVLLLKGSLEYFLFSFRNAVEGS